MLGEKYIRKRDFPFVDRIGLAARACGSRNGQSLSNSAVHFLFILGEMKVTPSYQASVSHSMSMR